ncbi:hypothetical protein DL769_009120 [Monosporascus sp. CRB-8-3]|nr:hypothetical protein DL769_009120 [Monosporascus sp. CRB-8-3]
MQLTDVQLTVAADMRSRPVRYLWDMLARSMTHPTIMAPMPGASHTRTPATTAAIPPRVPNGGIDEKSCLRLRPTERQDVAVTQALGAFAAAHRA